MITKEDVEGPVVAGVVPDAPREKRALGTREEFLKRFNVPEYLQDAFGEPRAWPELDAIFGMGKDRGEDAFEFLRRVRGE